MPGEMNGRLLGQAAIALRPGLKVLYNSGYTKMRLRIRVSAFNYNLR